jgi:hypothetical protein
VAATNGASLASGAEQAHLDAETVGDPVDVATGDVVVAETDVTLPGVLPLVIGRGHRSSRRCPGTQALIAAPRAIASSR